MKLKSGLTINGRAYKPGDEVSGWSIYPFFLLHIGIFGASGFFMAYGVKDVELPFLYLHGGIAILVYVIFYFAIFGGEEVKWMFINAGLGLFGIYTEINYFLSWFGKALSDFPLAVNVTPFLYYILYTFLLRQALLDATGSRDKPERRRKVEMAYVFGSLLVYGALYLSR